MSITETDVGNVWIHAEDETNPYNLNDIIDFDNETINDTEFETDGTGLCHIKNWRDYYFSHNDVKSFNFLYL